MRSRLIILVLPFFLVFFSSCEDQSQTIDQLVEEQLDVADPVVAYILSLGISIDNIQEYDRHYLAEGDLVFPKDMALPTATDYPDEEQYRHATLVSSANYTINIKINTASFARGVSDDNSYKDLRPFLPRALTTAIKAYNNLRGSGFRIQLTNNNRQAADITIQKAGVGFEGGCGDPDACGACGAAGFPSGGSPFPNVYIFPTNSNYSVNKLVETIIHEIGHCIGLRHTDIHNDNNSIRIETTPGSIGDPNSVMNSFICGNSWGSFSSNDIKALLCLYGTPSACTPTTTSCGPAPTTNIQGAEVLCTSNQNYVLSGTPSGALVTWSVSPSTFVAQATGTGTTASIRARNSLVSGYATLKYEMIIGSCSYEKTKQIWVGKPTAPTAISYNLMFGVPSDICVSSRSAAGDFYSGYVPSYATHAEWESDAGTTIGNANPTGYSSFSTRLSNTGYRMVRVRYVNACGASAWTTRYFNLTYNSSGCDNGGGGIGGGFGG